MFLQQPDVTTTEGGPPVLAEPVTNCTLTGFTSLSPYLAALDMLICVASIVGNLLVMVAVAQFPVLRTVTNAFVVALAAADFLAALAIPYYVSFYFDVPYRCDEFACILRYFLTNATSTMSILLLVAVSVDRFLAVTRPLRYPALLSRRKAIATIALVYVYSLLLNSVILVDDLNAWSPTTAECDLVYLMPAVSAVLVVAMHVFLALGVTTSLYVVIFREAWRQNRLLAGVGGAGSGRLRNETKTTWMMVLILGCTTAAMLPYALAVCLRYAYRDDVHIQEAALSHLKKVFTTLYFAKSAVNPVVYGWKNAEFAAAFRQLVASCRGKTSKRWHGTGVDNAIFTISSQLERHLQTGEESSSSGSVDTIETHL